MQTASSAISAATQRLAIDTQALDALKLQARTDPDKALHKAAQQFETVFLNMLMKSMRDATPKEGLFDSEATNMYNGMLDQQWVDLMSKKGIGIADAMVKQLERNQAAGQQRGKTGDDKTAPALKGLEQSPAPLHPINRKQALSTLDRINSSTLQGAQQMDDAKSPARSFIQRLWSEAKQAEGKTGVPAQFMLGQAALESGWGKREIRAADGANSHNIFGIKASGDWKGPVVETTTTEYVNGKARKMTEKFRAYGSYAEAFADYANLLSKNPRYAHTLSAGQDAASFASRLQKAGYATDPKYAEKLTQVIQKTIRIMA